MVHPDTFFKTNMYVDVKQDEVEDDVKLGDIEDDVKPVDVEVDVKPIVVVEKFVRCDKIPPPILPFSAVRTPPSADNLFACCTTATVSDPSLRFRSFRFRTQTHRDRCSTDISFTRRPVTCRKPFIRDTNNRASRCVARCHPLRSCLR
ncbi:unnamed protein product [Vicia faba]|uniref:Uncharacterized protein n=1 Tax=Vicia faba TaxID=3906 RepID=A0AAV0Z8Y2_VICFA|nr:unnamed protein product [Vicia faba]